MCFMIYVGTDKPLPTMDWKKDVPDVWVRSLIESERPVISHFKKAVVQYIGSTAGCGCDFPHVLLQNNEWRVVDDDDNEQKEKNSYNAKTLAAISQNSGEKSVEIYGIWAGNGAKPPRVIEEMHLNAILQPDFRFKEYGFYRIQIDSD